MPQCGQLVRDLDWNGQDCRPWRNKFEQCVEKHVWDVLIFQMCWSCAYRKCKIKQIIQKDLHQRAAKCTPWYRTPHQRTRQGRAGLVLTANARWNESSRMSCTKRLRRGRQQARHHHEGTPLGCADPGLSWPPRQGGRKLLRNCCSSRLAATGTGWGHSSPVRIFAPNTCDRASQSCRSYVIDLVLLLQP